MMKHNKSNCNSCECVWDRICDNAKKQIILTTIRGVKVKYKVVDGIVNWIPLEPNQNVLYNQSKKQICDCLKVRSLNLGPTKYPGTAQSYKWALLNHESIWL